MGLFGGNGGKKFDWGQAAIGFFAPDVAAAVHKTRKEDEKDRKEQAQHEALVKAAIANGVPPEQAASLPPQTLAQVVAQYHAPKTANEGEFIRTLRLAGIDPASPQGQQYLQQRAATMASPAPQMVGGPETGYQWVTPPAPSFGGSPGGQPAAGGPQPGAVVNGHRFKGGNPNDRASWEPVGGGGGNVTNNFRDTSADFAR